MLTNDSPYHQQFNKLLNQIRGEVDQLKDQIKELEKENNRLREKIEEIQDGQTDIFSAMAESERLALRHQVLGLISKIDDHLEENGQ
ncbi:hypothetical protein NC796_15360 [Aliifodinibius sp. S!AR15-10]|uniref:hypothetical protein n=1 Tax=Aliifodinibius sp. S!AR15-10 TaxID=2950437 RepID=UPI00285AE645|nr:hypothetical protein [Aliifodinibius sp. S!AR15-10]MDR8392532.1 hypothetical protein [Aliifodinibius sp. S!AR15-10]